MGSGGGPSLPCFFSVRELRARLARRLTNCFSYYILTLIELGSPLAEKARTNESELTVSNEEGFSNEI